MEVIGNKMLTDRLLEHCEAVCSAVTSVPGIGIAIMQADGTIVYANDEINRIIRGSGTENPTGRLLHEVFPEEFVAERMMIIEQVLQSGEPAVLRHIVQGFQVETVMQAMARPEGANMVVVITRHGDSGAEAQGYRVVDSALADLGPLNVLTPREVEVLALIGKGMRISEIARVLYRSPKTVENHRASIGRKLGVTRRMELARLAYQAGLKPEDSKRQRYFRAS